MRSQGAFARFVESDRMRKTPSPSRELHPQLTRWVDREAFGELSDPDTSHVPQNRLGTVLSAWVRRKSAA